MNPRKGDEKARGLRALFFYLFPSPIGIIEQREGQFILGEAGIREEVILYFTSRPSACILIDSFQCRGAPGNERWVGDRKTAYLLL
jgi:hypothetical protein